MRISWIILLAAFMAFSCDKVSSPIEGDLIVSDTTFDGKLLRKILVEDYTGQSCGNCPEAAETLKELQKTFKTRIVGLGVHAGYFADTNFFFHDTKGISLVCDESEAYDQYFGVSTNFGNPNGMVSREVFEDQQVVGYGNWGTAINTMYGDLAPLSIEMEMVYDSASRILDVEVFGEYFTDLQGQYNMVLLISEDSVIAPQKFYKGVLGHDEATWEDDYVHRHVLRGSITGPWGESWISSTMAASGESYYKAYTDIRLPDHWNVKHCSVVGFLYDTNGRDVLHVEEHHIPADE